MTPSLERSPARSSMVSRVFLYFIFVSHPHLIYEACMTNDHEIQLRQSVCWLQYTRWIFTAPADCWHELKWKYFLKLWEVSQLHLPMHSLIQPGFHISKDLITGVVRLSLDQRMVGTLVEFEGSVVTYGSLVQVFAALGISNNIGRAMHHKKRGTEFVHGCTDMVRCSCQFQHCPHPWFTCTEMQPVILSILYHKNVQHLHLSAEKLWSEI